MRCLEKENRKNMYYVNSVVFILLKYFLNASVTVLTPYWNTLVKTQQMYWCKQNIIWVFLQDELLVKMFIAA